MYGRFVQVWLFGIAAIVLADVRGGSAQALARDGSGTA